MSLQRGWWRRNLVGLCALLPVLAAGAWFTTDDLRDQYLARTNHSEVRPGADGWLDLPDRRFRLDAVTVLDRSWLAENDIRLPAGSRGWRISATVETSEEYGSLCGLSLIAADGLSYAAGPTALGSTAPTGCLDIDPSTAGDPTSAGPGSAGAPTDGSTADRAPAEQRGTALFLLPADTEPVELRIAYPVLAPALGIVPARPTG